MASKLTEKQQKFVDVYIELLEAGENDGEARKVAREAAGYAPTTSMTHIISGEVQEYLIDWSNKRLALGLPKAINKLNFVIDNPEEKGNANLLAAINTWLDRGGVTKKESKEVTLKIPTGLVILPAKAPLDEQPDV